MYAKASDTGKEGENPGLLEQWLREGNMSEEEATSEAASMFMAGMDTVSSFDTCMVFFVCFPPLPPPPPVYFD